MKKTWIICLLAVCLVVLYFCATCNNGTGAVNMKWLEQEALLPDEEFTPPQDAALQTGKRRASIFSWRLSLLNDGAFFDLSRMLAELEINRVYQEIPEVYLTQPETVVMLENLSQMGIETVFLTGERRWGCESLDEFYQQIDALCEFNEGLGAYTPITAVALDVETYTLKEWKEAPEEYFTLFIEQMANAYQYAHERGFSVIQVIPNHFDAISKELFEEFVQSCCDELSLMNYRKAGEISGIWNEVAVCRKLGKPVETIFETMPLNERYSVTEEKTYFYDGMEALQEAEKALLDTYGDSLGVSYHHYQTLYHVYTGAYTVEIYPYTTRDDSQRDENGQPKVLESILLSGSDGSLQVAYPYSPNLQDGRGESCFLATGIKPDVTYTVTVQSQTYCVRKGKDKLTFAFDDGKVTDAEALHVQRLK